MTLPPDIGGTVGKESASQGRRHKRCCFDPWVGKIPGIGNDNPPQFSCLENSMDRGAWRPISYEVTKSQTSLSLSLSHTHTHTQVLKKARNSAESVFPGLEDSLYSDFQSDTEEDIQLLRQIKCSY